MTTKNYNKIVPEVEARLREVEIGQATIMKDIKYLRESLDNHLATSVKEIHEINEKLKAMCPRVLHCYDWLRKVQRFVIWPLIGAAVTAGVAGLAWLIYSHCY